MPQSNEHTQLPDLGFYAPHPSDRTQDSLEKQLTEGLGKDKMSLVHLVI